MKKLLYTMLIGLVCLQASLTLAAPQTRQESPKKMQIAAMRDMFDILRDTSSPEPPPGPDVIPFYCDELGISCGCQGIFDCIDMILSQECKADSLDCVSLPDGDVECICDQK